MAELPRGTITMLFTDIEGSTRLLHELGRDAYVRALDDHRRLLRDAFTRRGGVEVEMQGDSFFFAFPHARDAVVAAVEGQEALASHTWERAPIRVRIGIHTGEPMVTGNHYAGLDVHRAARVMAAGHGGQVLVSETTRALVDGHRDELPALVDLGRHRLKDLAEAQHVYQVGSGDFPPPKTLNATNLPTVSGPLIGRERELRDVLELMNDGVRMVTVTGPGGTGKTRLALQAAAELAGRLQDGVFWIPLASLPDAELVLPAIAQALGAQGGLADHLAGKELLLLIDNAEHVLEAAVPIHELLAHGDGVRLLVTSRAPLRVSGEREYALDPLGPGDATALFCARADAVGHAVAPDGTIEAICRRLDGLPLAIELAAARTKLLDPPTLLTRLEHALPLLTGGPRDAPRRQQTLRDTIEWSYNLLSDPARRAFAALSVFEGGFSIEAAEAVCGADLEVLEALVDASLVKPIGAARFLMLETIREFAGQALTSLELRGDVERRHSDFFLRLAREADDWLRSGDLDAQVSRLELEVGNLLATLRRLDANGDVESVLVFATGIGTFLGIRGYNSSLLGPLERAVRSQVVDPEARARALVKLYAISSGLGDLAKAKSFITEAVEHYREAGDAQSTIFALGRLIVAEIDLGRIDAAKQHHRELVDLVNETGDPLRLPEVEVQTANIALNTGDWETAVAASERGLERRSDVRRDLVGVHLQNLMFAHIMRGERTAALAAAVESLEVYSGLGHVDGIVYVLEGVAGCLALDSPEKALELLDGSAALRRRTGFTMERFESSFHDRTLEQLRTATGEAALAELGRDEVEIADVVAAARRIIADAQTRRSE